MLKNKVELLSPAGDFEKLKFALNYAADAVYLGGQNFSLRANSTNFNEDELKVVIDYVHERGKKIYFTANIFAHNNNIDELKNYLPSLKNVDAIIVSDPGIFLLVKESLPHVDIHVSTQANITNYKAAQFWIELGAKRIILARELSFDEIKRIHQMNPQVELEAFVHGAMCISYSGRCLLSNFLSGRDANHGDCAQACRWKYNLVEQNRPNEFWPIEENQNGTFILNSKDMCMINYLDKIFDCGVTSLKIEGRMKSIYYVAAVTKIYREAIDDYFNDKNIYCDKKEYYLEELEKVSHRHYSSGFYFGRQPNEIYQSSSYIKSYDFVGIIKDFDTKTFFATIEQRNKIQIGDELEVLSKTKNFSFKVTQMYDENGKQIFSASHAQQVIKIKLPYVVEKMDLLRKKNCPLKIKFILIKINPCERIIFFEKILN